MICTDAGAGRSCCAPEEPEGAAGGGGPTAGFVGTPTVARGPISVLAFAVEVAGVEGVAGGVSAQQSSRAGVCGVVIQVGFQSCSAALTVGLSGGWRRTRAGPGELRTLAGGVVVVSGRSPGRIRLKAISCEAVSGVVTYTPFVYGGPPPSPEGSRVHAVTGAQRVRRYPGLPKPFHCGAL